MRMPVPARSADRPRPAAGCNARRRCGSGWTMQLVPCGGTPIAAGVLPASTTGRPWPGRRQGTARRTPAASLSRGRISCIPLALLGEDQLVVAGVAQAVHAVAVADQDLALPAQQLVAAEGLHLDRGRGGGRGAACGR